MLYVITERGMCCMYFLQSAEKQGNQLHMNVYKAKQGQAGPGKTQEVKELKGELRPAPPYPSRVKTVDKGTQVTPERDAVRAPLTAFNVDVMLSECKKSVVSVWYILA